MRIALVLVVLAACDIRLDPSQPIYIVPPRDWPAADVAMLDEATACWRNAFGLQLYSAAIPSVEDQNVLVRTAPLVCLGNTGAQFTSAIESRIDVCPVDVIQGMFPYLAERPTRAQALFVVLIHELGHVAGIYEHVDDPNAVMGGGYHLLSDASTPVFSASDRQLLVDAVGEVPLPTYRGCDDMRLIDRQLATIGVPSGIPSCQCREPCSATSDDDDSLETADSLDAHATGDRTHCVHDPEVLKNYSAAPLRVQVTMPAIAQNPVLMTVLDRDGGARLEGVTDAVVAPDEYVAIFTHWPTTVAYHLDVAPP